MPRMRLRHAFVAVLIALAMLAQGTWALAGTTGTLAGSVTDSSTGKAVADAKVTAVSPSQTATTTTDAGGHFTFISLMPDTYTVSVEKDGYAPQSIAGVTIFADQSFNLPITTHPELKTIAVAHSRAAGNLVKPGTTSDIYSVNSATQQVVSGSSGGYNLNAAYSAVYQQPGVTSYIGNAGWGQVFYIRGGAYSQTGYEFDGVPVNRAFDNYQADSLSSLGQQELQVYTGGSPAGASSATLGGYLNQVIKTGTYPGFGTIQGGIGAPGFYHSLTAEAGGATPNRMFSYYVGLQGYNQTYVTCPDALGCKTNMDPGGYNANGLFGAQGGAFLGTTGFYEAGPYPSCANGQLWNPAPGSFTTPDYIGAAYGLGGAAGQPLPVCVGYGPFARSGLANMFERDNVVNLHFGIPHKYDSGRDDVQLLWDNSMQYQPDYNSINDNGGNAALNSLGNYAPFFGTYGNPGPYSSYCYPGDASCIATGLPTSPYAGFCNFAGLFGKPCNANSALSPIPYRDGYIFGPGTSFGQDASTATAVPYLFPNSPSNRAPFSSISPNLRDAAWNDVSIVKLQYQKNIGSNAYARLFGYTFYSDWMINSPAGIAQCPQYSYLISTGGCGQLTADYELNTHTRGLQLDIADQINPENLLEFTGNYTTAGVVRFNNSGAGNSLNFAATNLTNGNPSNPMCFDYRSTITDANGNTIANPNFGAQASCYSSSTSGTYGAPTRGLAEDPCASGQLPAGSAACANGAKWLVTTPGGQGVLNTITPKFSYAALTDEWKPNDKLDINAGIRFERYEYDLANTNTPEFNYWFNAAAQVVCYDPNTFIPIYTPLGPGNPQPSQVVTTAPGGACPNGGVHPTGGVGPNSGSLLYTAVSPKAFSHSAFSPRFGITYTLSPDTVLRASAGRYTQPTETAFEQYINQSGKSAGLYDFNRFWNLGFHTPAHDLPIQTSNNADFSIEHHFHNTDLTAKVSPFYRYTTHQTVYLVLGPGFISGDNVGTQKSYGVEFQIQKGDPTRDGFAGALSYTYTKALMQYQNLPDGSNAIDFLNTYIQNYNCLTKAGYSDAKNNCTTADGGTIPVASPCYAAGTGAASDCSNPTDIKNPYYNLPEQNLLDPQGWYPTYPNEPPNDPADNPGSTAIAPHTFSGWLQYKHGRFAIAPNFQLNSGTYEGYPTDVQGLDPRACGSNQGTSTRNGVPIVAGSQNADFFSCGPSPFVQGYGYLAIPNPYSGSFDQIGAYQDPWQLNVGAQIRYDVSPKVNVTLTMANIYNHCFGGASTAWSKAFKPNNFVCGYGVYNTFYGQQFVGTQPGAGWFYGNSPSDPANGTVAMPNAYNYPFHPLDGALPFQAYLQVNIKL